MPGRATRSLWAGGGHVFAVGGSTIFHRSPAGTWAKEPLPPDTPATPTLQAVFGFAPDGPVYAVGGSGTVLERPGPL